ncbi:hypothetical protein ES703_73619 [subsurface metagenome]
MKFSFLAGFDSQGPVKLMFAKPAQNKLRQGQFAIQDRQLNSHTLLCSLKRTAPPRITVRPEERAVLSSKSH